ncbi:uncharacterized protein J8A68_002174 [[Candida] subhashii]|uniref:Uncharacterized protein n=1 Tax=[Candida] subhashii TaxID=561895 RepID=A0A8J5QPL4_9ASCO|nr:uncharacterized protein J8A68_002174 [[Candida] subhashii]KAG7664316.1 hypothetical protein J8A68_002174 [[Candida] subhashii]
MRLLRPKISTSASSGCNFRRRFHLSIALKQLSTPSSSSTTTIKKKSRSTIEANERQFRIPLVPERIIPINKHDITIDNESNIKLNSPITLQQAWNYFYATKQCLSFEKKKEVEAVRRKWFAMTNLMREDIRLAYQDLLQSGKDVWNKQHVHLKLTLSENISALTGVRFSFSDDGSGKVIVDDEVNLHHAEKYFNECASSSIEISNNVRSSFETLSNEEKLAYRDAYLELLSSGRDMYNGKIVPLTGTPSQNDDHPYIEPDPEEDIEIKIFKPQNRAQVCRFYVSFASYQYLPVVYRNSQDHSTVAAAAEAMAQNQYYSFSAARKDHYKTLFFDWYSRKKVSSMSSQTNSKGKAETTREITNNDAFHYFCHQKSRQTGEKFLLALGAAEWRKLSDQERDNYKSVYQKIVDSGYCMHKLGLIPIHGKESIAKWPKQTMSMKTVRGYHYLKRSLQLNKLDEDVRDQLTIEWSNLGKSEKNALLEELKQLVYEGKGECSTPEMITKIVNIGRSLDSQTEGIVPTRDKVRLYYIRKRSKELSITGLRPSAINKMASNEWKEMTLQEYDKIDREYRSKMPSESQIDSTEKDGGKGN